MLTKKKKTFNLFADIFKDDFPCLKVLEAELDLGKHIG